MKDVLSPTVVSSLLGAAFWLLPSGMERQLWPPETTGLYPSHHAWAHVHPVPQQPQPHYGPPPSPWGPPALAAHLAVLSHNRSAGHRGARGPPPGFPGSLPPRPPAHLQHLPPSRHRAPGHGGHQPPAAALAHLAPPGSIQAPLSPALLHCLACLHQFPSQPYQNKPVPLHLSMAAQMNHLRAKWGGRILS